MEIFVLVIGWFFIFRRLSVLECFVGGGEGKYIVYFYSVEIYWVFFCVMIFLDTGYFTVSKMDKVFGFIEFMI